MGIYSDGRIWGIRIFTYTDDNLSKTVFEQTYPEPMTHSQMREAFLFYTEWRDIRPVVSSVG